MHGRRDNVNLVGGDFEISIRDLVEGKLDGNCADPCRDEDYDFVQA